MVERTQQEMCRGARTTVRRRQESVEVVEEAVVIIRDHIFGRAQCFRNKFDVIKFATVTSYAISRFRKKQRSSRSTLEVKDKRGDINSKFGRGVT